LKRFVSGILLVLLFVCILATAFNTQPTRVNANLSEQPLQAGDTDWWSMFHHDLTHAGYSSSTAPTSNTVLWSKTTGGRVDSSPAVFGGVLFVGSDGGKVYAFNATTGALMPGWPYTTGGAVMSSPAVANGIVYVGSDDGKVYAFNATTGALMPGWPYTTGGAVQSSPVVVNVTFGKKISRIVFVGSDDEYVYALNATTGAFIWSTKTAGWVMSSPAVANGTVYVGSNDTKVYALSATSGTELWNYATGGAVRSSPVVVNVTFGKKNSSMVFVGSDDEYVYALNATKVPTTKRLLWNYETDDKVYSSPAFFGGVVFVGSDDDHVYAFNATTGALYWSEPYAVPDNKPVESSPAVAGGLVLVGSNGSRLYALNAATSNLVWNYTTGGAVMSSPAVANGIVYVGSDDGKVYAFFAPQVSITAFPWFGPYLDVGQSQTFTTTASGESGTTYYSYQWYLNGVLNSTATGRTMTYTPSAAGGYSVYAVVTDQFGNSKKSNVVTVTANPPPSVSISPLSVALTLNKTAHVVQNCTFTATAFNGSKPYVQYQWYNNSKAVLGANGASWTYVAYQSHVIVPDNISVTVTDNATVTSRKSSTASVYVNPYNLTISPPSAVLDFGQSQSQTFTATVSLIKASSYRCQWYVDGSLTRTDTLPVPTDNFTYTPSSKGTHTVYVKVSANGTAARSRTAFITVNFPLSVIIGPKPHPMDVGTLQPFYSAVSNGTKPYGYDWYANSTLYSTSSNFTFWPHKAGNWSICLNVTDSAGVRVKSNTLNVTVNPYPSVSFKPSAASPPQAPPLKLDVGQSILFTSHVSGGTRPFTYQWTSNSSDVPGATNATWEFTPSSPGTYIVAVRVNDSNIPPVSVSPTGTNSTATITVNPTLSVIIKPLSVILDANYSRAYFTSYVSGGTANFTYHWYLNGKLNYTTSSTSITSSTWISSPAPSGSYTVYVNVTDSATVPVWAKSLNSSVGVNPSLAPPTISPSSATIYADQNQTFISSMSGGNSPYSYQWYVNGTLQTDTTSSWNFTPPSPGFYNVYVNVTDNLGVRVKSNTATITVNTSPPVAPVTISPTAVAIDNGALVFFNSSGGKPPYQWYLNGTAVSGANSSSWLFAPNSTGCYLVYLNATWDSLGVESKSNIAFVIVNSLPFITIDPTSSTIQPGESQVFISSITGGTSPFTYQWYLNGSPVSGANSSSWIFTPSSAGSYTVYVNAIDSIGIHGKRSNATVTVPPHIVKITNVIVTENSLPKTVLGQGFEATVSITVSNLGNYTETFNAAAYANGTLFASQIFTLSSGKNHTILLIWNTAGFAYANYTITANVTLASGETNTWIGPSRSCTVTVTIPGDINGDGVVNGKDLHILAQNWLETVPPGNPNADIGGYGVINGQDLHILAQHWLDSA
jgi:outer membrane protein assembly factor BamB